MQQIDLPEDCIENVYGKGYRLKYPVKQITNGQNKEIKGKRRYSMGQKFGTALLIMLVSISFAYWTFWQNQSSQIANQLTDEKKQSIVELSKSDWQVGLNHIKD